MSEYLIDPKLPKGFQSTPNEERSKAHLAAWWDVPYIEVRTADTEEAHVRKHQKWLKKHGPDLVAPDLEAKVAEVRASFLANNPTGASYTVHCLDGGAWDRPTMWGVFPTLEEAKACCDKGPEWRRAIDNAHVLVIGIERILGGRLKHVAKHWGKDAVMILNDMHGDVLRDSDPQYLPEPEPIVLEGVPDDVAQLIRAQLDEAGNLKPEWIETINCAFETTVPDED